jgi:hypothetical protein
MMTGEYMEAFKINKAIPQVLDMILFVLVALSIYFKDSPIISGLLIAPAIIFMFAVVIRQANDCRKQHALYNFTMLVSAVNLKMDYASRLVRDVIIYGLHFYLFTLNQNYLYLASFGLCLAFDVLVYNAAFNPLMKNYLLKMAMQHVETAQKEKESQL